MEIRVFDGKPELGRAAAARAVAVISEAITRSGASRVIAATGASQFEFLDALIATKSIDWSRVELFHLDEYVGIADTHPASFRRYLRERIVERVHPAAFHFLAGDAADPAAECRRVGALLQKAPVDVAFVGIGENGHLAFNDPPGRLRDRGAVPGGGAGPCVPRPAARRRLVPAHRRRAAQRNLDVGRQILKAREILCIVPDARKANAVRDCLDGPVSPLHPSRSCRPPAHDALPRPRLGRALEARRGGRRARREDRPCAPRWARAVAIGRARRARAGPGPPCGASGPRRPATTFPSRPRSARRTCRGPRSSPAADPRLLRRRPSARAATWSS